MSRLLEIAVFSYEAARIAAEAGAERIELCSSYAEGGLSPSAGTLEQIRHNSPVSIFAMVRPRGGNFVYSEGEIKTMQRDIEIFQEIGVDGIVLGALDPQNRIDEKALKLLLPSVAVPLTFHRAFDLCPDRDEALEILTGLGFKRILSSGGEANAWKGASEISRLNKRANGRIIFMPGGGITSENINEIANITGCSEFHASARVPANSSEISTGFGEHVLPDPARITDLQNKIR